MKNIVFVSGTYIAALVGAGLASGAEITSFFVKFGKWGGAGVCICAFIFAWFLYTVLTGCKRIQADNITEYISAELGQGAAWVCDIAVILFMICVYSVMVAGAGELAYELMGINNLAAMLVFNLLCVIIITLPIEKLMKVCGILGLFLAVFITFFSIQCASNRGIETFKAIDNWGVSAISYSGYNILSCICILCPLAAFIKNKKEAIITSVLSGMIIFVILICMWGAISIYYGKIDFGVFPMLTLVRRQGEIYYIIYVAIMFTAIFTTAVSSAFGVYKSFSRTGTEVTAAAAIFVISSIIAYMGFDMLVNTVYRFCGLLGIGLPILILKNNFKIKGEKNRKIKKTEEKTN